MPTSKCSHAVLMWGIQIIQQLYAYILFHTIHYMQDSKEKETKADPDYDR